MKFNKLSKLLLESKKKADYARLHHYDVNFDDFKDWLSSKLQIKIGKYLGSGVEGVVYELNPYTVIKISSGAGHPFHNVLRLVGKNIPGIIRYYSAGEIKVPVKFHWDWYTSTGVDEFKYAADSVGDEVEASYVIMEKVSVPNELKNRLSKILNTFYSYWREVENKFPGDPPPKDLINGTPSLFKLFRAGEQYDEFIRGFIQWLGDPMNGFGGKDLQMYSLKMLKTIKTLQNMGIDPADFNSGNWGISKKRGLVLFDFWDDESFKKPTPPVKNTIR